MPGKTEWYYAHKGKAMGPFPAGELAAEIRRAGLPPDTLVASPVMKDWVPLSELPGLASSEGARDQSPGGLGDGVAPGGPPQAKARPRGNAQPARPAVVVLISILLQVHGGAWILLTLARLMFALNTGAARPLGLTALGVALNVAVGVFFFHLGLGALGRRSWAWGWSLGGVALGEAGSIFLTVSQGRPVFLFFAALDAVAGVLLCVSKAAFREEEPPVAPPPLKG